MQLAYQTARSNIQPAELETIASPTTVYLRRNARQITDDGTMYWEYEEAQLTKAEYAQYLRDQEINKRMAEIEDALFELAEGGAANG